jgi:uncharacterized protein YidB (DUF937 family)
LSIFDSNSNDENSVGNGLAKPVMLAVGALLVGKMFSSHGNDPSSAAADPGSGTGLVGGLSQIFADNAQASDAPDTLKGGLSGVLSQLVSAGHGDKVDSWIGQGDNHPIEPDQLASALGQPAIAALAQHAGIDPQSLLKQLSQVLPGMVDQLTASGQVPDAGQIASLLQSFRPA